MTPKTYTNPQSVESLFQKYSGQDIYVFGTGPTLFEADPAFFEDKVCLGINFAFEIMPHMNYILVHALDCYEVIQRLVDNSKLLLSETLVREVAAGNEKEASHRVSVNNNQAIFYPIQDPYENVLSQKQIELHQKASIFTWSTATHSAIHLAAYMGAKCIKLIGVDYRLFPNGKVHFHSKYSGGYGQQHWNALSKHEQGDRWLTKALKKQGIEVLNLGKTGQVPKTDNPRPGSVSHFTPTKVAEPIVKAPPKPIPPNPKREFLSICITVANRSSVPLSDGTSLHLLPNCLRSVARATHGRKDVEVVISDFHSNDWPLEDWVTEILSEIPVRIVPVDGPFNRGKGRNIAAQHASGDYLFFLDADMLIDDQLLHKGKQLIKKGYVYFPMCFYFLNKEHSLGFWCNGKGNVFISRPHFLKAGQWPAPPRYPRPFDEDLLFYKWVRRADINVAFPRHANFFHQYHPGRSVDDIFRKRRNLILPFRSRHY